MYVYGDAVGVGIRSSYSYSKHNLSPPYEYVLNNFTQIMPSELWVGNIK